MSRNYVQGKDYRLAGAGVAATDTSLVLTSMQLPNSGELVTMTMFGAIGFITIEPETDREENASFTGITQNVNGTATLTGVTRGLTFVSPSTADNALRRSHSGGTIVRVTNSVQFYENLANKYNSETIKGVWTFNSDTDGAAPKVDDEAYIPADDEYIHKKFAQDNYGSGNVAVAVDGVTITGDGTTGNPLVATPGAYSLDVQESGVSIETGVDTINFTGNVNVTNPAPGVVEVEILSGGGNGSNTIENLNAGETIDGVTSPKAVFIGNSVAKTQSLAPTTGVSPIAITDYDYSGITNSAGGVQVTISNTRRASSFTTPSHQTTVNAIFIEDLEGTSNSPISANIEVGIYTNNAGEPGTQLGAFTGTSYSNINNNYSWRIVLPDNIVLSASTTYWIVIDTGIDGGNIVVANNTDPGLGLLWNGSAWVAGNRFAGRVGLQPFNGDVYMSYYASTSQPRALFLGFTTQSVTNGDPIDVIHDGVIAGFTGFTVPNIMYTPTSTAGVITSTSTNAVQVGTVTKTTEIVINRTANYQ